MNNSVLEKQVGGTHFTKLQMQPILLITRTDCDFIQGRIIEIISCYKDKQDIEKCIHYSQLAIELLPDKKSYFNLGLGYSYIKANSFSGYQANIIIATLQRDFLSVIRNCKALIKAEY